MRTPFLGLGFDPLGTDDAARAIADKARRREAFVYVVTPNVDHLVRLERQPKQRRFYADAWLTLCDSRILELFARASKVALPCAPGADIVEALFCNHIRASDPVVVIGGTEAVVWALHERFPHIDLRWFDAPSGLKNDPWGRARCIEFIRANRPAYVFLAVGSPQQEMIAHQALKTDATGVAICCGASLEFLAGQTARAPGWMRSNRLEWLHRLGSEPGRLWRRYLIDGPRILGLWRKWATSDARG